MSSSSCRMAALLLGMVAIAVLWVIQRRPRHPVHFGGKEGGCIEAKVQNAALVEEWRLGAHGQKGINCFDCHGAEKGAPDGSEHNGALIHVIVSPKDCARCHPKEVNEQKGSHHAKAGQILASLDNFLGEVLGGSLRQFGAIIW